jgi:hypothetical protein
MILYGLGGAPLISCSRGILSEIPYTDPKEVIEKQGVGFEKIMRNPIDNYFIAREYLKHRKLYLLKTDFFVETVNIKSKKGFEKPLFLAKFYWYGRKPWRWMGGWGYTPHFVKVQLKKAKAEAEKAQKLAAAKMPEASGTRPIGVLPNA